MLGCKRSFHRHTVMKKAVIKQAIWPRFNVTAISLLTLIVSSLSTSALAQNRPELFQEALDSQSIVCSSSDVETLIGRWRESYLPAGSELRECGDSAIASLTTVMNDDTVPLRTRYLTARLIGQIGSEPAVHSLFTALGNNLLEEASRRQLQSIGLKGIETFVEREEDSYSESSFSNATLPRILRSQELPTAVRLGAMKFAALYVAKQEPAPASNFFRLTNRTLSEMVADENEARIIRLSAANTLSELIYHVSGDFLVEASSLEWLVAAAEGESDAAIRQSAVKALMMTYYMTASDAACWLRWEEIGIAKQAVSDLASRPYIDSLWDLGPAELSRLDSLRVDKATALKNRVALNNLVDLPHPAGEDTCVSLTEDGVAPSDAFIQSIESENQPRLYALLVAWARSL